MRRRSWHWMSQQRDIHGRFTKGRGGSNDDDWFNEWFAKAPWWQKILAVLGMLLLLWVIWETGLIIPLAILGWIIILAK